MATERTFSSAFGQMAITNEPLTLWVQNPVKTQSTYMLTQSMKYGL